MKVIVTGGREYNDFEKVSKTLKVLNPTLVVEGGALGADRMARFFAKENDIPYETFEADWTMRGRAAGPMRNRKMCETHPDAVVVAFPGGIGTANCIRTALSLGMVVLEAK